MKNGLIIHDSADGKAKLRFSFDQFERLDDFECCSVRAVGFAFIGAGF